MNDVNVRQQTIPRECPSQKVLADLTLGKLPLDVIECVGQHVEACPTCQSVMEGLDAVEDSVIADIKGQVALLPPGPELESQMREAEQISRVVWGDRPADANEEPVPGRLGQYEVLVRIGQGGMGAVYKARHPHLRRLAAIKMLPGNRLRDPQAVARFQREMEAVGRLDHPNLVRAHDAGEAEGRHFLVMEFLDGTDLRRLVRYHGPFTVADACEIVRQAALGLHYAHEHGLVHRDVKPSNLMLTTDGTVKVLDLGLARLTDESAVADDMTNTGQIVGTGDFIAPEQGQDTRNADARSDIYSLGCTLYYLLVGRGPFTGPRYATFVQKVMAHAREPILSVQTLRNDVPDIVAKVIERMTAKAPEQRYPTVAEVAEALAPWAVGCNLRRLATGVVATARGTRVAGTSPAPAATRESEQANGDTPHSATVATAAPVVPFLCDRTSASRWLMMITATVVGLVLLFWAAMIVIRIIKDGHETAIRVPEGSDIAIHPDGSVKVEMPPRSPALGAAASQKPNRSRLAASPQDLPTAGLPHVLEAHFVNWFAFSPDGSLLATAGNDVCAQIRDAHTGALLHKLKGHRLQVRQVAFSPDGATLATVCFDQTIKLWDPATGTLRRSIEAHGDRIQTIAYSPDGRLIATGGNDHQVQIHDASTGELLRTLKDNGDNIRSVVFSPDGRTLASGAMDSSIRLWDTQIWQCRRTLSTDLGPLLCIAFHPAGSQVAGCTGKGGVEIWDLKTGKSPVIIDGHSKQVYALAFSLDGAVLATASGDRTVKLWDASTGRLLNTLAEHEDEVYAVAFSPDGQVLVSGGKDNTIRCWRLDDILKPSSHAGPNDSSTNSG